MQLLLIRVVAGLPNSQGVTVTSKIENEQQGFGREKSEHGSSEGASEMLSSRDCGGGAGGSCLWGLPVTWMYPPCVQQGLPQEKITGLTEAHCGSPKFQTTARYVIM